MWRGSSVISGVWYTTWSLLCREGTRQALQPEIQLLDGIFNWSHNWCLKAAAQELRLRAARSQPSQIIFRMILVQISQCWHLEPDNSLLWLGGEVCLVHCRCSTACLTSTHQLPTTIALWNRPLPPTTLSWSWKMSPDISKCPLEDKLTPLRMTVPGQWGSSGNSPTGQSSPFPNGKNSYTPLGSTGQIPALSVFCLSQGIL